MSILDKKAIIDFDSEMLSVMTEGVLMKRVRCAVIKKKSETPVAIAYGEEAEKRKRSLASNEMYIRPFRNGKIDDEGGAKILFKSVLRDIFGKNPFISVYVLVSGGLSDDEKQEIKYVISSVGYGKVYIIPRPAVLATVLANTGLYGGLYMDNDVSEFVLAGDKFPLTAQSTDVSLTSLSVRLASKLLTDDKLQVEPSEALSIVKKSLSLFKSDSSLVTCLGQDTITVSDKKIYFYAKDTYPLCDEVFSHITSLIEACLMDADKDFALLAAESGILCIGEGTHFSGFNEYFYQKLGIVATSYKNDFILLSTASAMIEQELL